MGLFRKNLQKMSEEELSRLKNGWEYVPTGYCVVNLAKLEKTISLMNLLVDLGKYYTLSPIVDKRFAENMVEKYHLDAFVCHDGVGYTVKEFFSLISKQLWDTAGFTADEIYKAEKIEQGADSLDINTTTNEKPLVVHTNRPNKKAPYEERIQTQILIGDVLNILGYFANVMSNNKNATVEEFYKSVVATLAEEGQLSNAEISRIISGAEAGLKEISKVKRK